MALPQTPYTIGAPTGQSNTLNLFNIADAIKQAQSLVANAPRTGTSTQQVASSGIGVPGVTPATTPFGSSVPANLYTAPSKPIQNLVTSAELNNVLSNAGVSQDGVTSSTDPDEMLLMEFMNAYGMGSPDLMGYLPNMQGAYSDWQSAVSPYRQEQLALARGIAGERGDEVKVLDALKSYLAQRAGNYENLLKQSAGATSASLGAYTNALADPALLNRFRTTEGAVSPQALASAYTQATPTIEGAQQLADTIKLLVGTDQENIAKGLQAYQADLAAKQFLSESLGQQVGYENQAYEANAALQAAAPELASQDFANQLTALTTGANLKAAMSPTGDASADYYIDQITGGNPYNAFAGQTLDQMQATRDALRKKALEIAPSDKQTAVINGIESLYRDASVTMGDWFTSALNQLKTIETAGAIKSGDSLEFKDENTMTDKTEKKNYLKTLAQTPVVINNVPANIFSQLVGSNKMVASDKTNSGYANWIKNNDGTYTFSIQGIQPEQGEKDIVTGVFRAIRAVNPLFK